MGSPISRGALRTETVSSEDADVILSTAHKFKGKGQPDRPASPRISRFLQTKGRYAPGIDLEEAAIAYVSITARRARVANWKFLRKFQAVSRDK